MVSSRSVQAVRRAMTELREEVTPVHSSLSQSLDHKLQVILGTVLDQCSSSTRMHALAIKMARSVRLSLSFSFCGTYWSRTSKLRG